MRSNIENAKLIQWASDGIGWFEKHYSRHLIIDLMIDPETDKRETPFEVGLCDRPIPMILYHGFHNLVLRSVADRQQFARFEMDIRSTET